MVAVGLHRGAFWAPKSTGQSSTPPSHHKTHLNFTQLNTPQLNSSHLTFGPSPGLILEPLGPLNRPKIGPSRLLTPYFFKNVIFHEMQFRPGETPFYDPKTAPKTTQDRPKTAPRRSSRADIFDFVFVVDFGLSWVDFDLILASLWAPKCRAPPVPAAPCWSLLALLRP